MDTNVSDGMDSTENIFQSYSFMDGLNVLESPISPLSSPFLSSDLSSPDISSSPLENDPLFTLLNQHSSSSVFLQNQQVADNVTEYQDSTSIDMIDPNQLFQTQNDFPNVNVNLVQDLTNENEVEIDYENELESDVVFDEETEDKPKKRGRKRQRKNLANENLDISAVDVSREDLLKISSREYDTMIKRTSDQRALTWAEEKHIKIQRRLIKNRESAQASRQRKKAQVDDLATQVSELKLQNSKLQNENVQLRSENRTLKDEITKFHSLMKKTSTQITTQSVAKAKTGMIMLIALFSFGLLFNLSSNNNGINIIRNAIQTSTQVSRVVESASNVNLPIINSNSRSNNIYQPHRHQRALKEFDQSSLDIESENISSNNNFNNAIEYNDISNKDINNNKNNNNFENNFINNNNNNNNDDNNNNRGLSQKDGNSVHDRILQSRSTQVGNLNKQFINNNINNNNVIVNNVNVPHVHQKYRIDIDKDISMEDVEKVKTLGNFNRNIKDTNEYPTNENLRASLMEEFSNESNSQKINASETLITDESLKGYFDNDVIKYRSNTAYFTCNNMQQLTVPQSISEPFNYDAPFYVSFIVPQSSLPHSQVITNGESQNSVVEINCRVVDVVVSPAGQLSSPLAVVS